MVITIDFNIFSAHKCMTLVYVTNLQTVTSFNTARATIDSNTQHSKGQIKRSLKIFIGGSNNNLNKMILMIQKINMVLKKTMMMSTQMKSNR